MDWLYNSDTTIKRSHFKNLVSLALIDGTFDDAEREELVLQGEKWGLSRNDMNFVINNLDSVEIVFPESHEDRIDQLYDLVMMMIADAEVNEEEMDFVQTLAVHMGFKPSSVPRMLNMICESARKAEAKPSIDVGEFLGI